MLDTTASFCEIQTSELKKILLKKANLSQMSMYLMETIATTTHLISVNDFNHSIKLFATNTMIFSSHTELIFGIRAC